MEDIIRNKNIFLKEEETYKYSISPKFTHSFHRVLRRNNIMGKSSDKRKKICNDLSLMEEELKFCSHDQSDDVADLIIKNDVDFKLKIKEKTVVSIDDNDSVEIKNACKKLDRNTIREKKHKVSNSYNEIIEIKCNQKFCENTSTAPQCQTDILIKPNKTENYDKSETGIIFSNDPKGDLQSLLIMMAMSTTHNDGVNLSLQSDNGDKIEYNLESSKKKGNNIKSKKNKKSIDDEDISGIVRIEILKPVSFGENIIIRKYVNKWLDYVRRRKESNRQSQKLATINKFFERLERKKASLNQTTETNKARLQAHDYSTYQHRYKVQKHIIALQKAKLEQQNRFIEELKYNKIIEASRQSLDVMKEDVRLTYYEIDKHLKPKIKCLTNELKIREIEDNSLVLHCLKVPQFLQRMEARAREREEKHALIRERRKQMEEERIRIKQEAELAKAEMDKEEKIKRIIELREKRRHEKVENIRKKQYAERMKALIVMADLHYEKNLQAKYGIKPFKLLLKIKNENMEKAKAHSQFQMKKCAFLHWMWYTEDMWYERNFKADDFYRKKLLKKTFVCFKKNHNEYLIKLQVAIDYYDLYVVHLVFKKLQESILVLKKEFAVKWNTAVIYFNSNLLFKTLTCWRTLPALNALKREQDARKMRWREKVLQVVPDYVPPEE